uniref:Kynureninase n=1 Tax=Palpitomonas bilix TaxID=652834 RepID=A0A7S3DE15_9EUKA|mmetsp:Transcript_33796/g.86693  ORF Transcript_33796/g.86693 Transcript_33796/m.86693 type:complete len:453 (+) Transcript_33796:69-1427(+)|eukprot:CAMPEP_0113878362 /NCGR_PEP_ID=MMETSP0780_2-20120614/6635_1 /TAXON_ID=652834 /ORGANISM="Palpitomonas bilix" /LENGTH=452 /DNA_ID=CAMNT_0000864813 /DNA_START=33 /DNA_END=1391 /DNA_ORIENTATION=- /assembly_acc=CAM_ASM_000599
MDAVKERAAQLGLDVHSDAFAKEMDNADELASYRGEFHIPKKVPGDESCEEDSIYLCGNSLGLQPKVMEGRVMHELKKWQTYGVEGHFVQTHEHSPGWAVIDQDATPMANIVGAKPAEVAICNTLSVNLHLLLVAFYRPEGKRVKILMEAKAFPSDQYAMESHMRQRGISPEEHLIEMEPREGEATLRTEDILSVINQQGDEIALVLFGGLQYYTGQFFDVEAITKAGHEKGCIVGWDFAHAAGNIDLKLHEWDIDFACWCTYKYLNSGPGALGGLFVHEKFHSSLQSLKDGPPRFAGWWGNKFASRFQMDRSFDGIAGASSFALSNPPVVAYASIMASLEVFNKVGMEKLRAKSKLLTAYLELLLVEEVGAKHLRILTPSEPDRRGCQLSLQFKKSVGDVFKVIQREGVICDKREPDVIRIAPTPMYNTFSDVRGFVNVLKTALTEVHGEI